MYNRAKLLLNTFNYGSSTGNTSTKVRGVPFCDEPSRPREAVGPTEPLAAWVLGALSPGIRQLGVKLTTFTSWRDSDIDIFIFAHRCAVMECPGTVLPFIVHHHLNSEATGTVPL